MAQKTFIAEQLTSADVNLYLAGEGGAWTSWTPTVTQVVNVVVTNTRSRFARYGRTIHFSLSLVVTGAGTASGAIFVSLPVTAAASDAIDATGYFYDNSANIFYVGAGANTTTTVALNGYGLTGLIGTQGFTAGLAVNDVIRIAGTYEAAS